MNFAERGIFHGIDGGGICNSLSCNGFSLLLMTEWE